MIPNPARSMRPMKSRPGRFRSLPGDTAAASVGARTDPGDSTTPRANDCGSPTSRAASRSTISRRGCRRRRVQHLTRGWVNQLRGLNAWVQRGPAGPACPAGTRSCSAAGASRTDPDNRPARRYHEAGCLLCRSGCTTILRSGNPRPCRDQTNGVGVNVTSRRPVAARSEYDAGQISDRERALRRDRVVSISAATWRRRGRRTLVRPM